MTTRAARTTLEAYVYLGLNTIVERGHPEPNVNLTYIQQSGQTNTLTDGGDLYTGLDRYRNTTSDSGQALV